MLFLTNFVLIGFLFICFFFCLVPCSLVLSRLNQHLKKNTLNYIYNLKHAIKHIKPCRKDNVHKVKHWEGKYLLCIFIFVWIFSFQSKNFLLLANHSLAKAPVCTNNSFKMAHESKGKYQKTNTSSSSSTQEYTKHLVISLWTVRKSSNPFSCLHPTG